MIRLRGITIFLLLIMVAGITALSIGSDETHLAAKVSDISPFSLNGWGEHHTTLQEYADALNAYNAAQAAAAIKQAADLAALQAKQKLEVQKVSNRSSSVVGNGRCGGDLPPCGVMMCESGGKLVDEGPMTKWGTAKGKWQILDSTWGNYKGYPNANAAPENVQDERARQIYNGGRGRSQWSC